MSDKTFRPLRDWNVPSYDPKSGRSASAFKHGSAFSADGLRINPSSQVDAARAGGVNGAPGTAAMSKSGSADPGRQKWGGSKVQ
jgi:hypothetical protein